MTNLRLLHRKSINLRLYRKSENPRLYPKFKQAGDDYIVNESTGELHRVGLENFWGSHNLSRADLNSFIGLTNMGILPAHVFRDGKIFPVYDRETREFIGGYVLNKCKHCFSY